MNAAIVVAGGTGERSGLEGGKQLAIVCGRPVLSHTLQAFVDCPTIDEVVVVVHPDRLDEYLRVAIDPLHAEKVTAVVGGGDTRQQSVANGLAAVSDDAAVIAVHDGARPLVTASLVASVLAALEASPTLAGLVVGHPSYDTLKDVDPERMITGTPDRARLWVAQTPQVFRASILRRAYERAEAEGLAGTDDASLVEGIGEVLAMFPGPQDNTKITAPEDLLAVERLLELRAGGDSDG